MYASIDVGTNTLRLLIGQVSDSKVIPETYFRGITRLGGGFTSQAGLSDTAMLRTVEKLVEFSEILRSQDIAAVNAVATEALRRASNATYFQEVVHERSGINLEIIPGELEARLSCAGVLSGLNNVPEHLLIFDIGGGSTEFVYVEAGKPVFFKSYPLGTVMLCEHHPGEIAQQAHIDRTLRNLQRDLELSGFDYPLPEGVVPVGTAGTVTTLAAIDMKMERYDWSRVNNYRLDSIALQVIADKLSSLSVHEREELSGMEKGRGDLILPGLKITESILDFCCAEELMVSDFGLLEGGLLRAAGAL